MQPGPKGDDYTEPARVLLSDPGKFLDMLFGYDKENIPDIIKENKYLEGVVKLNKEEIDFDNCKILKNTNKIEGRERSEFRFINGILKDNKTSNKNTNNLLIDDKPIEFESRRKKQTSDNNSKKLPWDNKFEDYLLSNNIHIESRRNKKQII